ncbi:MAG TPA: hypothetical protein VE591_04705 [Candidatus Acidoferrum sp.]|jgi:uncharacterized membrane protein YgcG|nr:hypothetical protein [Candidatus Acidoferrum sp.]
MPFELNVAVKQSPVEPPATQSAPGRVTVVDVTGTLSAENATELTRRLEEVGAPKESCVLVRFVGDVLPADEDPASLEIIGSWMKRRRADGYSIYVDLAEARPREALMRIEELKQMVLPAGADPTVPRRVVGDSAPD